MDQLQPIFPGIPAPVLEQVLRICDDNLEAATDYLLENDWEELQMHNNTHGADHPANGQDGAGHAHVEDDLDDGDEGDEGEGDDNDEDEDDDDEDDEDEDNMYYESGDDGEAGFRHRQIPPLAKRVKITTSADGSSTERYWVACDADTVEKSMIELLNISLTKFAHQRIVLLNQNTRVVDKASAELQLHAPQPTEAVSTSLKRKLPDAGTEPESDRGYFAYFFSVADLDMVWRSVLHAHVFNKRFGDVIEFHTASTGAMGPKAFDELFHVHTHQPRSTTTVFGASQPQLKCCLVLPCATTDDEINRVGKNVFSLLNITGSLYFRASSKTLGDDGNKLTEDVFRRYTTHRLVRHEEAPTDTGLHSANGILGYQPPKKIVFTLERLDANKRAKTLSDDE
ncbi:hypothetical protein SDRG_04879 [Saprolegnia diclina VS20]|uniref:CUE domain-containing protein n=1 Tax=Saprolegnia diclina (strain VS20) TaxID=1156394 RepID=T0QT20_SAPDV|nr:hypothetical protein SDRG_04879 [Saprolegnia diclina VS20]EQC37856.1 hypothetical protein SDRG_04879 [Saprolegnia diclina VS20]|eukprot:XP_008608789.1 hypothetical protein SDRG_04879 [Saprolegnia diclina VS20]